MPRQDIDYDYEDFGMSPSELEAKYTGEQPLTGQHPTFVRVAHQAYTAMPTRDVKLSYWDWVAREIAKDNEAIPSNEPEPAPAAFQEQLTEQQVEDAELVDIKSIDQFAGYIAQWHGSVVNRLRHFLAMPEGQTVTVTLNGVTSEVVLSGEAYKGFQAGMLTAILQFESLPFAVSVADAQATDAGPTQH